MEIKYDTESDTIRILWGKSKILESDEVDSGIILDYNSRAKVVGIEILNVSKRGSKNRKRNLPRSQDFPFFGMTKGDKRSVEEVMDELRGGRLQDL